MMNKGIERAKEWLENNGFQCSIRKWSDSCGLWAAGGFEIKVSKSTGKRWWQNKKVCIVRFWNHGWCDGEQYWTCEVQELKDETLLDQGALYQYIGRVIPLEKERTKDEV